MDEGLHIRAISERSEIHRAAHLFDAPPTGEATERFLASGDHHLLLAYDGDTAVGMISGVELTHPDKGTEMFLYELGVDEPHRRRGIARQLIDALAGLARERGCYGMWVAVDADNGPARKFYAATGPDTTEETFVLTWTFDAG